MGISEIIPLQESLLEKLLEKYDQRGPRYTSYPTAPAWSKAFTSQDYRKAIAETYLPANRVLPVSLYVHIPFCESRCLFCSCNVIVTKQKEQAEKYLSYLFREIEAVSELINRNHQVVQSHWGGGTPTYLSSNQIERLFKFQSEHFSFSNDIETGIEVDPTVTTSEQIHTLRSLGFNRISLGVQDFDCHVQQTVHRIQSYEVTENLVEECRSLGFNSINFDLIYGLPYQTVEKFDKTVSEVIRISPDRIALYNYAYVPWLSPHQKMIPEEALPTGKEKLRIFIRAISRLLEAGYIYIGMDHFAKPSDNLSHALSEGMLQRNFMGYTVQKGAELSHDSELYGFGVSAISALSRFYAQNHKKLSTYYDLVNQGSLPTERGYALSDEDLLRRRVIMAILCQGELNFRAIEAEFRTVFQEHFATALKRLETPLEDGLVVLTESGLKLTSLGRIFSRNIAMIFDAYLENQLENGKHPLFSKTL